MNRFTHFAAAARVIAAAVLLSCAASLPPVMAADLPPDAAALLPAGTSGLVVFSTLADADQAWQRLGSLSGKTPDVPRKLPSDLVGSVAAPLLPYIDRERPVAIAARFASPLSGQPFSMVVVLPLVANASDPYFLRRMVGDLPLTVRGSYVAVSDDSAYAPDPSVAAFGDGLPDGAIAARLDLEQVFTLMGPYIEMGLQAMSTGALQAAADSSGVVPAPPSPTAVEAMQTFFRGWFEAGRRCDLALSFADGRDQIRGTFAVNEGSMFDLGPQPDHGRALELARFLTPDRSVAYTSAVDYSRFFDRMIPFYAAILGNLPADGTSGFGAGYVDWIIDGLRMSRMWMVPAAYGFDSTLDGLRFEMIAAPPDAQAMLDSTINYYRRTDDTGTGLTVVEEGSEDIDGVLVRTFTMGWDPERLAKPATSLTDSAAAAAAATQLMLRNMLTQYPPYRVAALPGLVVVCADRDPDAMRALLARVRGGAGAARTDLEEAAAKAGAGTNLVVTGDVGVLLNGVMRLMPQLLASGSAAASWPEFAPLPFVATTGVRGLELDFDFAIDVAAFATTVQSLTAAMKKPAEDKE